MTTNVPFSAFMLFTAVLLGGWLQKFFATKSNGAFKLMLSFSAAYLLALSILHILPEVFSEFGPQAGWLILGGFFLQIILDYFSHGIEHGHAHTHADHHPKNFLVGVMAALWVHAFIEGMPFGGNMGHFHHHSHMHTHGDEGTSFGNSLLIGISFHKLTEGFVVAALLRTFGFQRLKLVFWLIAFALVAPLGAFLNQAIIHNSADGIDSITTPLLAILVGIMLHVSTIILFENDEHHRFNISKLIVIMLGIASVALMT
jgi:zinc transporter ZupT